MKKLEERPVAKEVLARTIYGEARGEYALLTGGIASLICVGNVVLNRVKARTWYGKTVREVCQKPFQFSCWNAGDPNFSLIQQVDLSDPVFKLCWHVAQHSGEWPDLTKGATHYYSLTLKTPPSWASKLKPVLKIGNHLFLR